MSRTEEKRAAFSLAPWKRLWRCVCQHRLRLALAIGSNLLLAVADFYIPLLQSRVVDQFILTGTTAGFGGYAVQYIGVCLFEIAMLLVYFKACMGLEMLSGRDMKEACFVNLQKLSLDYYNVTSAGHTLSRVMSDTDRIATCIAWVFPDILWGFAYILGVLGVMLSLSPGLAMTIIVIAPIVTALTVYFQKKLIALNRDVRAQHSKITSSYNEGIMGAKTSKTLALEGRLTDEFEQTTAQAAKAGILHGRMRAIYVPLIVLCGTLAASATLLRGGRMALSGRLSLGVLSAFMTYALSLFQTFRQQAARISQMISLQANVERVVGLIDEKPTVQDSPEVEAKYGDCFHPKRENWEEMRGEIDFAESFRRRVAMLKGLDESVMADIAEHLPFTEGLDRLMHVLKRLGFKTAILSGGFTYFGNYLRRKYGFDYVYANELEIEDGKLTGRYLGDIVDGKRKAELLKLISQVENVDIAQTIAVGDGANDLPMLSVAGLGIAFHAKPKVKATAGQSLSTVGLDGILYFLGYKDSYIDDKQFKL